ncbi:MAG TPA: ATP-binding protein [Geobacteraceae bacterium]
MQKEVNQRLKRVNECFLSFTPDPDRNMQLLTECCGELMGATCALYNRLENGMLHALARWHAPDDFNPLDNPDGHICHDVIKTGGQAVFVLQNLDRSGYAKSDPNVSAYCLRTYIGAPVNCRDLCVGSLCVVYQNNYSPDEEEKKLLQILAAAMGVEEERRGELAELRAMRRELEERVAQRTHELMKAQEELDRSERLAVVGRLAGSVGHELRNPLGVMSNAVYFLKTLLADGNDTIREYLEIIRQEIENSQRIISDLLDFSRNRPPQLRTVMLREMVHESLRKCVIPGNIELHADIPDSLPPVEIDPLQMGQVFQNLVVNAVQAMPKGGSVRISARLVQGSGNEERGTKDNSIEHGTLNVGHDTDLVEISVADTGEGIAEENMRKLFQPLFTTKLRGVGLGLVVCRNLTEANGGRIDVESRPGKGATFTVTLPAAGARA